MQQRQVNKPIKVNLDKSKKYLAADEAFYMLNRERNINGTGTLGKTTPLVANYLACLITQPAGDNYTVGKYFSILTNELYWWVYNTNGVHYIARINGDGTCEIVYDGDCLPLSAAPEHSIEQWRCYLKYDKFCAHQHGKQLIWTDGENPIGQLDVEASIATDSFTTPFFEICPDDCAPVQMCVPEPCKPLEGEFVPLVGDQVDLTNHLLDVGIKVRFRHIYYDQRKSEWSEISTLYFQDSKGCFDAAEGFPRCLKFRVPVGNPLVDKIEFAYSTDNGIQWFSSDVIEKYEPYSSSAQYWYERELADLDNFSEDDCSFDYFFCNDKECNPIAPSETNRVFNPMPRKAQGILRVKNSLGFYNYIKGSCPLDETETKKMEISINCPDDNCVEQLAEVKAYAIIVNNVENLNGLVFRYGGAVGDPDDISDVARFGAARIGSLEVDFAPDGYGQSFKNKTRNFIAYIEGTDYWAEMKQYKAGAFFNNPVEVGIVSGMNDLALRGQVMADIYNGNFYVQEYKFKVPKGTKGYVRLASHTAQNGLPSEGALTSTFVLGSYADIRTYSGNANIIGSINSYGRELYFDTCAGDVEIFETLVIDDNYIKFSTGSHSSSAYSGTIIDANNIPVEGAEIWYNGSLYAITDFNGAYHFYVLGDGNDQTIAVELRVELGCIGGFSNVKTVTLFGGYNRIINTDIQITDINSPTYKSDFYETVNVPVLDCDGQPVGGVRVALSGSKYQVSDAVTGIATFRVRNYGTRARAVRAVVMDSNNCFSLDCSNNCNPCLPSSANTTLSACFSGKPSISVPLTTALNKLSALLNRKGLKSGGRYPFGIVAQGDCGRLSAVYPITVLNGSLAALDNYLNIPKTQEKGVLSFCDLHYDGNGIVFPDWANCAKIVRGVNVNNYELQWVVDKIERTSDRKIKLTIQSLNDYNARYNFQTNTIYQYQKNDRAEIISNGNGDIFDIATYGLLNYQVLSPYHDTIVSGEDEAPADFFNQILIDDDGKLDGLTVGAKIELQRPKECTVEPEYFTILSLDIIEISGEKVLAIPSDDFETFDTFIVNRQIDGNFPQQFEHKFPSDHWGQANANGIFTGLSDVGKVHFVNKFENERRYGRNITINSENQFNRFGDLEKTLDAPEQGDLTAMGLYDGKIGLGIGEFDNFLFQVSDEFLRLGTNGLVQAAPADSLVSDTQPKVSGMYGCRYDAIGSIFFGDGLVTWIDSGKSSYVKHNFNVAIDISEGKFNTWVKKRVQFIDNFNATAPNDVSKYRYCTGYNNFTNALQLTVKSLTDNGINNQQEPFLQNHDTILIEPRSEELLTFASYVQEAYSNLKLNDDNGCAFVSFLKGQTYIHPILPIRFNEFNGVAVDTFIGFAMNLKDQIIRPIAMQIQSETRWFATKITVDDPTFESEIPPIRWTKTEDKYDASFLCDKNSKGGLYGTSNAVAGRKPRGYFCAIILCRDNTQNLVYNSIDNAKRIKFDELDLLITKFMISAESGYVENV